MGPQSYMRSVADRNVVMRRISVFRRFLLGFRPSNTVVWQDFLWFCSGLPRQCCDSHERFPRNRFQSICHQSSDALFSELLTASSIKRSISNYTPLCSGRNVIGLAQLHCLFRCDTALCRLKVSLCWLRGN